MPLHKIELTANTGGWAIWHIAESEPELEQMAGAGERPENTPNATKRIEWLAGRILAKTLAAKCGLSYEGIGKDSYGKPFLVQSDAFLSLSHSSPYVAVQISRDHDVGIDIEQPKEKLLRIAPRVLSREEFKNAGDNLEKNCVYWCAKEALYKIYGKRGLIFSKHLQVDPFDLGKHGRLTGHIRIDATSPAVQLNYLVEADFVLVYTS